ncbi:MAG TPA: hypothetical protein VHW02_12740 [Rhizomicrobium sp.]|jgi:hypothetical protein|nr:hypothetical protein [Rhizomicrobium sp.]
MKKAIVVLAALLIAGGGIAYSSGLFKINLGANAGSCQTDSEIAQQQRAAIDDAAMSYVRTVLGTNPADAYDLMTKEARAATTADKFGASLRPFIQAMSPENNIKVAHTYYLQSSGSGPDARAICGPVSGYQWVSLEIKPGQSQAHVEISGQSRNNDLAFNLWLLRDQSNWRVQYFHFGLSSIVGLPPETLLQRARQERDAGHLFNAAMLYAGVQATIDRGPAFQLGIQQELQEDLAKFQRPVELNGTPPFLWNMNGQKYSVAQVTIGGIAGKLGLAFILPQTTWNGFEEADKSNKAFLTAFIATHPDYARVFNFLVARALKPDRSGGFGTVYENGKGFDEPKK